MPRARGKKVKMNEVKVKENEKEQIYVAPFLQQEIISEILSYLPVDSLLRCKCVCKLWCTIIQKPEFIRKHMTRAEVVEFYDASEHVRTFNWITCLDGLIVEKSRVTNKYRIRNPATRQVLSLPDPDDNLLSIFMFYVPTNQDYKLVSLHCEIGSTDVFCKFLNVSNHHTWKDPRVPCLQNFARNNARVLPKCTRDAIHTVRIVEAGFGDSEIISIDVEAECVSSVKIPRGFFTDWNSVHPMDCDGKIAIAAIVEEELHIWVLHDYKKKEWAERKIVHPLPFMKDFPNATEKPTPWAIEGSRLVMFVKHQRLLYNTDCKKILYTTPPEKKILGYIRPSAVYLRGMQPQQRIERNE